MPVNSSIVKSPLGILKILTMVFALLGGCLVAKYSGSGFENDRFTFMLVCGLLLLFWSLVTFLLYLFDLSARFQPGTMRSLEIVGAVFALLLIGQAFAFAAHAASKTAGVAKELEKLTHENNDKDKMKQLSEREAAQRKLLTGEAADLGNMWTTRDPWMKAAKLASDLNAAAAAFWVFTIVVLAGTIFVAKRFEIPGTQEKQGAYVG